MNVKKIWFYVGIIIFCIIQIALIDMWGKENGFILMGGFLSLSGGAIGAFSAYFIAKRQIEQQDSMKIIDIKLNKYEYIASQCLNIENLVDQFRKIVEFEANINDDDESSVIFLGDIGFETVSSDIEKIYEKKDECIMNIRQNMFYVKLVIEEVDKIEEYFEEVNNLFMDDKLLKLEDDALSNYLSNYLFNYLFDYSNEFDLSAFRSEFEEEIENILKKNKTL